MPEMHVSPYRKQLIDLVKQLGKDRPLVGAEVGTNRGACAHCLLNALPNLTLHMIDIWAAVPEDTNYWKSGDPVARRDSKDAHDSWRECQERMKFAGQRAVFVQKHSLDAVPQFVPDKLDFAFIDADHTYDSVLADCRAWWGAIKPGGFLSGHDYGNDSTRATWDVRPAWDYFAAELGRTLHVGKGNVCWIWK